jgi:uncharacterized iron-regulated membrane protein
LPLDTFIQFGLDQRLPGHLEVDMPPSPNGTIHVRNRLKQSRPEVHFQLDRFTGKPVTTIRWEDLPAAQKVVATGINLHEGQLLGRVTQVVSTLFATTFMLLAAAAAVMWWKRRPQGKRDWPKRIAPMRVPTSVSFGACALGLLFPLFGASLVLCLLLGWSKRPGAAGDL